MPGHQRSDSNKDTALKTDSLKWEELGISNEFNNLEGV